MKFITFISLCGRDFAQYHNIEVEDNYLRVGSFLLVGGSRDGSLVFSLGSKCFHLLAEPGPQF